MHQKSMHLINKRENKRKKYAPSKKIKEERKKNVYYKYRKICIKEPGRAGGQCPAAWPGGNDKSMHLKQTEKPAAGGVLTTAAGEKRCRRPLRGLQNQKEGVRKAEKRGKRAKSPGLAARQG